MGKSSSAVIRGGVGNDVLGGTDGADVMYGGMGNDILIGGAGGDSLYGEDGNDTLMGGVGSDVLDGGLGNDRLVGFDGADVLLGGAGMDYLIGGGSHDVMTGGADADTFAFDFQSFKGGTEVVTDFSAAEGDVLQFVSLLQGFDPLTSAISDFVKMTTNAKGDTAVYVDANGAVGGSHFSKVVTLTDSGALDEDALFASHQILVA